MAAWRLVQICSIFALEVAALNMNIFKHGREEPASEAELPAVREPASEAELPAVEESEVTAEAAPEEQELPEDLLDTADAKSLSRDKRRKQFPFPVAFPFPNNAYTPSQNAWAPGGWAKPAASVPGHVASIPAPVPDRLVGSTATHKYAHKTSEDDLKKIFFINVKESHERFQGITQALEATAQTGVHEFEKTGRIPYERWDGIDSKGAQQYELEEFTSHGLDDALLTKEDKLKWGTIAVYLSHARLLKKISEQDDKKAVYIILEDDFIPNEDTWLHKVMHEIKELPADWDVHKFAFTGNGKIAGLVKNCQDTHQKNTDFDAKICSIKGYSSKILGNQGYAVRPEGARLLLEHLSELPVMDIDEAMLRHLDESPVNYYLSKQAHGYHGGYPGVKYDWSEVDLE